MSQDNSSMLKQAAISGTGRSSSNPLKHKAKQIKEKSVKPPREITAPTKVVADNGRVMAKADKLTMGDIYHVSEYCAYIEQHMLAAEAETQPRADFIKTFQTEVSENNRCVLVDWLVGVHMKFKLLPETLYITMNLVDRYLSQVQVSKANIQLVGLAALLIASKYEEIYPPDLKDILATAKGTFSRA